MSIIIALLVGCLIGTGIGGFIANWANDNVPQVHMGKPFRFTVIGGRREMVAVVEVRMEETGGLVGTFVDYKTARRMGGKIEEGP